MRIVVSVNAGEEARRLARKLGRSGDQISRTQFRRSGRSKTGPAAPRAALQTTECARNAGTLGLHGIGAPSGSEAALGTPGPAAESTAWIPQCGHDGSAACGDAGCAPSGGA